MDPKDEIKEKCDLRELISEYLPLKPAGSDSFKGLCPFHSEKSPSFHVSPDKRIWHCFGCAEGGDCFSFVMKMEGMSFPEALMHLGAKYGVEIRRVATTGGNVRQRLLEINTLAQKFYTKVLVQSTGAAAARSYVESRAIPPELQELFGLGYAPDAWDTLSVFLTGRGYAQSELVEAGLSMKKKSGGGVIDRFRHRLMIPLRDHHGNTVGFTARQMPGQTQGPKYMNSPETPVYKKGELVYGLDVAKRAARATDTLVIVEGNLDVIASHKADVPNIVASSGTALTQAQLELMKRYAQTIVFAFDTDAAGFEAGKKGIELARGLDLDVRAAIMPEGVKDPDELVQADPQAWKALVDGSVPIMEFLVAHMTRGKDLSNIDDKRAVEKELVPALGQMSSVVEREHWLQVVADVLGTPVDQLRKALTPMVKTFGNKSAEKGGQTIKIEKLEQARRLLFGWVIAGDEFDRWAPRLSMVFSGQELWITLYNQAQSTYDSSSQSAQTSFFSRIRDGLDGHPQQESLEALLDSSTLMADHTFHELPQNKALEHVETLFHLMEESARKKGRENLARDLRLAEQAGDTQAVEQLLTQLKEGS